MASRKHRWYGTVLILHILLIVLSFPLLTATQCFLWPLKAKLLGFGLSVSKKSLGYIKDKSLGFFLNWGVNTCAKIKEPIDISSLWLQKWNATSTFLRTRTMFQLSLELDILKDNIQYKFISISGQVLKYFSMYVQFLRTAESFPAIALKYYGSVFLKQIWFVFNFL